MPSDQPFTQSWKDQPGIPESMRSSFSSPWKCSSRQRMPVIRFRTHADRWDIGHARLKPGAEVIQTVTCIDTDEGLTGYFFGGGKHGDTAVGQFSLAVAVHGSIVGTLSEAEGVKVDIGSETAGELADVDGVEGGGGLGGLGRSKGGGELSRLDGGSQGGQRRCKRRGGPPPPVRKQ